MTGGLKLKPVDRAEIVTVADNLVDQVAPKAFILNTVGSVMNFG